MKEIAERATSQGYRSAIYAIDKNRAQHNHQTDFFLLIPTWLVKQIVRRDVADANDILKMNTSISLSFLQKRSSRDIIHMLAGSSLTTTEFLSNAAVQ